jgi:hypothetical protein
MNTAMISALIFLGCAFETQAQQTVLSGKVQILDHRATFSFLEREEDLELSLSIYVPLKEIAWQP